LEAVTELFRRKKAAKPANVSLLPSYREKETKKEEPVMADASKVDAILEKISQKGMQSLTAAERKLLEQASERLKKG
jgi:hypothetical protein